MWYITAMQYQLSLSISLLRKCLSFGEKIVKIGPVDPGIIRLKLKKEITEGKI